MAYQRYLFFLIVHDLCHCRTAAKTAAAYHYLSMSVVFTPLLITRVLELCSLQSPAPSNTHITMATTSRPCLTPLDFMERIHAHRWQQGRGLPTHYYYYLKTLFNHNLHQRYIASCVYHYGSSILGKLLNFEDVYI